MASLTGIAAVMLVLVFAGESGARDLRPSDHGLEFQTAPLTGLNHTQEMKSFFNGKNLSPTSNVALPKAMNSSDSSPSSWWRTAGVGGGGRNGGGDHVRNALVIASLVCGITGVILLVASGLLYVFKYRKQKSNESSSDNNTNNSKLQLVVRNP
ncbi:hypothetical protein L6164_036981 [Bauhinia variegata]|uniref:Uncharacterized protein n=1 Tax=Bauhinia variegata TaxID=167791 RepID=A0ACB9KIR0_BAUVA|nr:hypothetical protein L6164_036981 [Bauhinia variegata]